MARKHITKRYLANMHINITQARRWMQEARRHRELAKSASCSEVADSYTKLCELERSYAEDNIDSALFWHDLGR